MATNRDNLTKIGPYDITEVLGRGGMATVYRGMHRQLNTPVAIKVMATHLAHDELFVKRFVQEAQLTAKLREDNIITIHDFGEEEGRLYLAMEFIDGSTLKEMLGKPVELQLAVEIIRQVCEALDVAHSHDVIHRDIKPSNILMDVRTVYDPVTKLRKKRYRPVLADFGIAKAYTEAQSGLTATGMAVGTPDYMSPEQGLGETVDRRSDIYSLGVVLFEMLTGIRPFRGETPLAVLSGHVSRELPSPRSINPDIPPAVEVVIKKALAKRPEERFDSAGEFAWELEAAVNRSLRDGFAVAPAPPDTGATVVAPINPVGSPGPATGGPFTSSPSTGSQSALPTGGAPATGPVTPPPVRPATPASGLPAATGTPGTGGIPIAGAPEFAEGLAAEARGDYQGAYEAFFRAYRVNPNYENVALRLQAYEGQGYRPLVTPSQPIPVYKPPPAGQSTGLTGSIPPAVPRDRERTAAGSGNRIFWIGGAAAALILLAGGGALVAARGGGATPTPAATEAAQANTQSGPATKPTLPPKPEVSPPNKPSGGQPVKPEAATPKPEAPTPPPSKPNVPDKTDPVLARLPEAQALVDAGDLRQAVERFRGLTQQYPGSYLAHRGLGSVLAMAEVGGNDAIAGLERATQQKPDDAQSWALLALVADDAEQTRRSREAAAKARELGGEISEVYATLALQAAQRRDSAAAKRDIDKALQLDPKSFWSNYANVRVNLLARNREATVAAAAKLVEVQPKVAKAHAIQGRSLPTSQRAEADAAFKRAIAIDGNSPSAHVGIGWLLWYEGKSSEAQSQFEQVLKRNETYVPALAGRAWALYQKREYEDAIAAFQNALKQSPDNADALAGLGLSYVDGPKNLDQAENAFKKAVEIDPFNADAHLGLADIYAARRQAQPAEAAYRKAVEVSGTDVSYRVALARYLIQLQRFADAKTVLQDAAKIDANNADVKRLLDELQRRGY
ncbi:MAG: protein kinase [Chloroflexi bacterium]|nr:protein kinase [Chloroflexota bacterium]